jgi:hypothetical protein
VMLRAAAREPRAAIMVERGSVRVDCDGRGHRRAGQPHAGSGRSSVSGSATAAGMTEEVIGALVP